MGVSLSLFPLRIVPRALSFYPLPGPLTTQSGLWGGDRACLICSSFPLNRITQNPLRWVRVYAGDPTGNGEIRTSMDLAPLLKTTVHPVSGDAMLLCA